MKNLGLTSFYGLVFGIIGTFLGGLLGAFINLKSNRFLCFILELAAGLMTSIICFDLIPEALEFIDISFCIFGILIGIFTMIICNELINKHISIYSQKYSNSLFKTGLIVATGLAIHNFPEGLAIRFWV